jgi:hypothetical protein
MRKKKKKFNVVTVVNNQCSSSLTNQKRRWTTALEIKLTSLRRNMYRERRPQDAYHKLPILSCRGLLGCDVVWRCGRIPTIERSMVPPSSGKSGSMDIWNVGILPQNYHNPEDFDFKHHCHEMYTKFWSEDIGVDGKITLEWILEK